MIYRLNENTALNAAMIEAYIDKDKADSARKARLHRYYVGEHDIVNRRYEDASKPNNKVVNGFPKYITDFATGFFAGKPVAYSSTDEAMLAHLNDIFAYNDEAAENSELARDMSIYGIAVEMLYVDSDGELRFRRLPAENAIIILDDSVEEEMLYFIRYWEQQDILYGNTTTYIEVYSRNSVAKYEKSIGALRLIEEVPHSFGLVPISIYKNNAEMLGDFEGVISLIDAYDSAVSDSVNELDQRDNAFLVLQNLMGTDENDIIAAKESRVLLLPENSDAKWLTKALDVSFDETTKTRMAEDIHKFALVPNLSDKEFAANSSGVAMRFKLLGLELLASTKERFFKLGIQRRIELLCSVLRIMGYSYDYRNISMTFTRDIPQNLTEVAELIGAAGHLLSKQTQLAMLPIDLDISAELDRKAAEDSNGYELLD